MIQIFSDKLSMSVAAARCAASRIRHQLQVKETLRLVAATGASQLSFLNELAHQDSMDWSRVELFHLDEYIGIGPEHPASFARYIRERIIEPLGIPRYHLLDGLGDPQTVISDANA